jgi:hypothetical protein
VFTVKTFNTFTTESRVTKQERNGRIKAALFFQKRIERCKKLEKLEENIFRSNYAFV